MEDWFSGCVIGDIGRVLSPAKRKFEHVKRREEIILKMSMKSWHSEN
ncbi:hypothetical protein SS1G_01497 [Sclerotinia sclerotiorum 1980 UF-70]|uniref:Uncharacterized protein n=1 Tax=Sclerotinia sclerotiorum (strain ATCC 18683 / 1980 / Ss-1) TaxID=665079 RepID=A7E869_SCLS1|nr:hypothetical protein SS1G_01497 [Sclerotinia sclerotiorum 1980 UF-70]EDN96571.1 hypothetical protein SS1G_01497 [Sclerotinia sclerotiorum 1980 UF-70]